MFRQYGITLINIFRSTLFLLLWLPAMSYAISVGNLTFSLASEEQMVVKQVVNNNKTSRIYRVAISVIDRPGDEEKQSKTEDGELLFSPRMTTLQPGEEEVFKFYYHGPKDAKERYYRVTFTEIPVKEGSYQKDRRKIFMEPIVVLDTILVVRPRKIHFSWDFDLKKGTLINNGNTWFKFLLKPGCTSTEEEGEAFYLRPGDMLHRAALQQPGNKFIIYNEEFIKITDECRE